MDKQQRGARHAWRVLGAMAMMLATVGMMGAATPASAQAAGGAQGRLVLHWGDPAPVRTAQARAAAPARIAPRLRVTLLADDGRRIRLDTAQARRAAGDLYALANRRVAVTFTDESPLRTLSGAAARERRPEVIVPADRLGGSGGKTSANGQVLAAAAVNGTTRWVTLACKFSDIAAEQKPVSFFQSQYGDAVGQLGHYWKEVSYGRINLAGSTAQGWFTLPQPRAAYVTQENGEDSADLDRLFQDCVSAADAQVDFSGVQGINMMFNGELDGFAWGGGACATMDGARSCTRVTWNPPWSFANLAPLAHEMGHGYGLPHSDNSDGDDDTYDNPWDVMSDGWRNAVYDPIYGTRPKHVNMLQRDRLGWVAAARKQVIPAGTNGTQQVDLDYASLAAASGVQLLVLSMPAQADPARTVSYTLEARRPIGNYEAALAGNAVIIHRVVGGTGYSEDAMVPPADVANNEGSMFKPGESWNTPDGLYRVRVDSATATGFRLTVTAGFRVTGGNQPARKGTPPAASTPVAPVAARTATNAVNTAPPRVQRLSVLAPPARLGNPRVIEKAAPAKRIGPAR